jgi:hypothetical protein
VLSPALLPSLRGGGAAEISRQDEVVRCAGSVGQSTMYGWDETKGQPVASWSEFSGLYRAFLKRVTVSEIDREERPVYYACVPSDSSVEKTTLDFVPITFLSCFFIQSAKGNASRQGGTLRITVSHSVAWHTYFRAV